ncbi:unnamed protein product [Musa textilis]
MILLCSVGNSVKQLNDFFFFSNSKTKHLLKLEILLLEEHLY